jgi:hypothetical protein
MLGNDLKIKGSEAVSSVQASFETYGATPISSAPHIWSNVDTYANHPIKSARKTDWRPKMPTLMPLST